MSPRRRLVPDGPDRWRIERTGAMRVPGVVYASQALLPAVAEEEVLEQVANVATLPGIVSASYAMPDVHWGMGSPSAGWARCASAEAGRYQGPVLRGWSPLMKAAARCTSGAVTMPAGCCG